MKTRLFIIAVTIASILFFNTFSAEEEKAMFYSRWNEVTEFFSVYSKFITDNDTTVPKNGLYRKNNMSVFADWEEFEATVGHYVTDNVKYEMLYNSRICIINGEIWTYDTTDVLDHIVYQKYGKNQYKDVVKIIEDDDTIYTSIKVVTDAGTEKYLMHAWRYDEALDNWLLARADELYFSFEGKSDFPLNVYDTFNIQANDIISDALRLYHGLTEYYDLYEKGQAETVTVDGKEYILTEYGYTSWFNRLTNNVCSPDLALQYMENIGAISCQDMLAIHPVKNYPKYDFEDEALTWKLLSVENGKGKFILSLPIYDADRKLSKTKNYEMIIELDEYCNDGSIVEVNEYFLINPNTEDASYNCFLVLFLSFIISLFLIKEEKRD